MATETVAAAKTCDLVCEGGGVKGIGLAGAYATLEERGYKAAHVAGTSAGAITAALIAAGYTAAELKEIVLALDFRQFEDKGWEDRLPLTGIPLSLLLDQGIYEGIRFHSWLHDLLAAKGIETFAQLRTDSDDPRYAYRLQVIVSDISGRRLLVLPRDAGELGLDPDLLDVSLAVRMSMSIPIFFEPVRIEDTKTNHQHVLVDGGILSNFPVWLFDVDADETPKCPTFGLLLVEPDPKVPISARLPVPERGKRGARGLVQLLSGIVHTMMEAHDRLYVEKAQFARTIGIPTLGVGTTEFDISRDRALALYDSGGAAASKFLESWDFDAYVAEFRTGKEHSRRDEIAAELRDATPAPAA
ncbi:MAG TPA: patatin-like phospholipase family protein [Gaiellaceae bacterium]|nr:patatin-like phospholipase family protein [Gaiellaceae bacterium]